MKHIQRKMMRKLGVGAVALSLLLSALPAVAADQDKNMLELRLQSGSNTAVVNGPKCKYHEALFQKWCTDGSGWCV